MNAAIERFETELEELKERIAFASCEELQSSKEASDEMHRLIQQRNPKCVEYADEAALWADYLKLQDYKRTKALLLQDRIMEIPKWARYIVADQPPFSPAGLGWNWVIKTGVTLAFEDIPDNLSDNLEAYRTIV